MSHGHRWGLTWVHQHRRPLLPGRCGPGTRAKGGRCGSSSWARWYSGYVDLSKICISTSFICFFSYFFNIMESFNHLTRLVFCVCGTSSWRLPVLIGRVLPIPGRRGEPGGPGCAPGAWPLSGLVSLPGAGNGLHAARGHLQVLCVFHDVRGRGASCPKASPGMNERPVSSRPLQVSVDAAPRRGMAVRAHAGLGV